MNDAMMPVVSIFKQHTNLFSGSEIALRANGWQRANKLHAPLIKLRVEDVLLGNNDREAIGMPQPLVDHFTITATQNTRGVLS